MFAFFSLAEVNCSNAEGLEVRKADEVRNLHVDACEDELPLMQRKLA